MRCAETRVRGSKLPGRMHRVPMLGESPWELELRGDVEALKKLHSPSSWLHDV